VVRTFFDFGQFLPDSFRLFLMGCEDILSLPRGLHTTSDRLAPFSARPPIPPSVANAGLSLFRLWFRLLGEISSLYLLLLFGAFFPPGIDFFHCCFPMLRLERTVCAGLVSSSFCCFRNNGSRALREDDQGAPAFHYVFSLFFFGRVHARYRSRFGGSGDLGNSATPYGLVILLCMGTSRAVRTGTEWLLPLPWLLHWSASSGLNGVIQHHCGSFTPEILVVLPDL